MSTLNTGAMASASDAAINFAQALVTAWDALPDGQHNMATVERWIVDYVQPAVDQARAALATAPVPESTPSGALRALLLRAKWIGQQTTPEEFAARAVFEDREDAHEAYRALVALRDAALASPPPVVPESVRRAVESLVKTIKDTIEVWDKYPGIADDGAEALWQILPHVERLLSTPSGQADTPPGGGGAVDQTATDDLVDRFAAALKAKLRASEAKYGWQNGWLKDDWAADCQRDLLRHVGKGDPLDVAAYAAFCWHHGWATAAPTAPEPAASNDGLGDGRAICEALGFDPTNHHNALKCPYCNPKGLGFAVTDPRPVPAEPQVSGDGGPESPRLVDLLRQQHGDALLEAGSHPDGYRYGPGGTVTIEVNVGVARSILLADPRPIPTEPQAAGDGWQPIETAPKTGQSRLVWCPDRQNTYAVSWNQGGGWDAKGAWCIFGGFRDLEETPTHWRPLPAPPKSPADAEGGRS